MYLEYEIGIEVSGAPLHYLYNAFSHEFKDHAQSKAGPRILRTIISIESAIHVNPVTSDNFT